MDKITSSGKEIVSSGSFITVDKSGPNTISIEHGNEKLTFELNFINDKSKGIEVDWNPKDGSENTLLMNFYNFNNSIGTGSKRPLRVGSMAGKELLLNIWIYALTPESSKKITYTFFLGENE